MKAKLNKLKSKKGFTLVEIIVVLVILAILAAATVPTMLGYVEEARGKSNIATARTAYVSAQSIATEMAAFNYDNTDIATALNAACNGTIKAESEIKAVMAADTKRDMTEYAKRYRRLVGDDVLKGAKDVQAVCVALMDGAHGKVKQVTFTINGYEVTIIAGGESVIKKV